MRVKGPSSRKFKKKILKLAKGFRGKKHTSYRRAKEYVFRALQYQYRDRSRERESLEGSGSQGSTQGSDPMDSPTAGS
jgi:ribosomal protein L20